MEARMETREHGCSVYMGQAYNGEYYLWWRDGDGWAIGGRSSKSGHLHRGGFGLLLDTPSGQNKPHDGGTDDETADLDEANDPAGALDSAHALEIDEIVEGILNIVSATAAGPAPEVVVDVVLVFLGAVDDDGDDPVDEIEGDDDPLPGGGDSGSNIGERDGMEVGNQHAEIEGERGESNSKVQVGGPIFGVSGPGIAVDRVAIGLDGSIAAPGGQVDVKGDGNGDEDTNGKKSSQGSGYHAKSPNACF